MYPGAINALLRRAFKLLLQIPGDRLIVPIQRGPARGLRWIVNSQDHSCWLGTYEAAKQEALARYIAPGMTVYDLGANAGFYTLMFSRLLGPQGQVFAFEPGALPLPHLLRHLAVNRVTNVRVIQAAVSDRAGLRGFTIDLGTCMNQLEAAGTANLIVPVLSLDEAELPPPDLIKIDVEGAESAVLRGATGILREHAPTLFIALHSDAQRHECWRLLRAAGYQTYALDHTPLRDFAGCDEIYALHGRRFPAALTNGHAPQARRPAPTDKAPA